MHWKPSIAVDEKGIFEITFPDYKQKSVKLFIEGMDLDGKLISDTITVQMNDKVLIEMLD